MNNKRLQILGVILALAGVAGLYFGGFSYSEEKEVIDNQLFSASIDREREVQIPQWLSGSVLGLGVLLMAVGFVRKK